MMLLPRPQLLLSMLLLLLLLPSPTTGLWWLRSKTTYFCGSRDEVEDPTYRVDHPDHVECMAGGAFNIGGFLSGRYMCRESYRNKWLPWLGKKNETICVATVAGGVIAELGDRCGCCDGSCPQVCTCKCGDDANDEDKYHVLVYKDQLIGKDSVECISQGKASRWTAANEEQYQCVPEDQCYLYTEAPTSAPTFEPTYEPTSAPTFEPTEADDGDDSDDFWDLEVDTVEETPSEQEEEEESFGQWEGRKPFAGGSTTTTTTTTATGVGEGFVRPREEEFP